MILNTEKTFEILLNELQENKNIRGYYRFLNHKKFFEFRKSYFIQRLDYINRHINKPNAKIWDIGCGYGTTGFMLAINGHEVMGSTLEYYFNEIENRKKYWSQFGDISKFNIQYENLFDIKDIKPEFDYILLQDTMHHLEPVEEAVKIIQKALKPDGKVIIVDTNGNSILENLKQFIKRGNKRIIEVYDEKLDKKYLVGNENFRSLKHWTNIFAKQNLYVSDNTIEYTRLFPPYLHNNKNSKSIQNIEFSLAKKNNFIREYGFFGLSFILEKK